MPSPQVINLGGISIEPVDGGSFRLDAGTMFGIVPKAAWLKKVTPDSKNLIQLACNVVLVRAGSRRILIDTGLGDKWDERSRGIYSIGGTPAHVSIKSKRLSPEDITDIVLTHLHFDHAAGLTRWRDPAVPKDPILNFPNATCFVQKDEWQTARHPNELNRGSYIEENIVPLALNGKIVLIEGEKEIQHGITIFQTGGHTAGHQAVRIEGFDGTVYVIGDLICSVNHLRLAWITSYDRDTYETLEAKKRLLAQAAQENAIVWIYHDPQYIAVRVKPVPGEPEYSFEPVFTRENKA